MAEIVIAFGCEIRDGKTHASVIKFLNDKATSAGTNVWTYPKAKAVHRITIVYTKAEFAAALDQKDAIIIYDGHSRIGQGPAFGPSGIGPCPDKTAAPLNPWGDSFRMGYDVADIECIGDIMHHGTNPAEFLLPKTTKGVFASGGLNAILDGASKAASTKCSTPGSWRMLSACSPKVAAGVNCRGDTTLATRHFWRSRAKGKEFDTLVAVGDADLKKTKLACSVLFMNSCSSKSHYYAALARHKKATKSACAFYMTAEVCSGNSTEPFMKAILKGKDPIKDAPAILKLLSGVAESGFITFET